MAQTILGLGLLLIPFLCVYCFQSHLRGFLWVASLTIASSLFVGLVTQYVHIFTYPLVVVVHGAIALAALFIFIKKVPQSQYRQLAASSLRSLFSKNNIVPAIAFAVIFSELFSIHYAYTGIVSTVSGIDAVFDSSYSYPMYSDEWVGSSFVDYSIKYHQLPLVNTLWHNTPLPTNRLFVFYAFLSEIFVLVGLNPLSQWAIAAIASGMLLCLGVFVLLRANKLSPFVASVATLCVPFIVNGGNLPGLWYLFPFIGGLLLFLLTLSALSIKDFRLSVLGATLSLLLYPPLIVFVIPALLFFLIRERSVKLNTYLYAVIPVVLTAGFIFLFMWHSFGFSRAVDTIFSVIVRDNLDGGIASFAIWNVVPIVLIAIGLFGLYYLLKIKKYYIAGPSIIGFIFWAYYAFNLKVFIIEYDRIVVTSCFLLMVLVGFGLHFIVTTAVKKYPPLGVGIAPIMLQTILVCFFVILSFLYPVGSSWSSMVLRIPLQGGDIAVVNPAPPINRYFTQDDMRLFAGISGATFIAPPWKGLVVGVATHNYPLESKASIIANTISSFSSFVSADCAGKLDIARKYEAVYAYSPHFECPFFTEIGQSAEGLYLYHIAFPQTP